MTNAETQSIISPPTAKDARNKRVLWIGLAVAAVLVGVIFALAFQSVQGIKQGMETELLQRQKNIAGTRADVVNGWLKSQIEQAERIVSADLFKIFAAEVDKLEGGVPLLFAPEGTPGKAQTDQLSSQIPLMKALVSEAAENAGFSTVTIANSALEPYISTAAVMAPLGDREKGLASKVVQSGKMQISPLFVREGNAGLTMEMYIPIMPPDYQRQDNKPAAVLILSLPMGAKTADFLAPGAAMEKGLQLKLVQRSAGKFNEVPANAIALKELPDIPLEADASISFAARKEFGGAKNVYSYGAKVNSADFWLVAESDAAVLNDDLAGRAKMIYSLAAILSVALVLLVSLFWWRLVSRAQTQLNSQYCELLLVIEDQKKLLDGINSTISDPISLIDGKGIYKYVNRSFAKAVGRAEEDVIGLDGPAVFGFDTAKRLNASDQHVLMTGESVSVNEVVWLQSQRYHFQISKTPLREPGSRTPVGIVAVYRDITKLVETEEKSRRVVQQTIDALVRTIEEADPFLGGHSRIMAGIAVLMAKQLRMEPNEIATVEAAANLSQIGKMYVPREILLKPGALTPEEKLEMERHVEHARNALKDIEFDLPVVDCICQMNERLDGKGYPKGLEGERISLEARVVSVANAFAAMAKPRSYRAALPVSEVLNVLEKQSGSYDQEVVAALRQVINTPAGERIVEQAAQSKAL